MLSKFYVLNSPAAVLKSVGCVFEHVDWDEKALLRTWFGFLDSADNFKEILCYEEI